MGGGGGGFVKTKGWGGQAAAQGSPGAGATSALGGLSALMLLEPGGAAGTCILWGTADGEGEVALTDVEDDVEAC